MMNPQSSKKAITSKTAVGITSLSNEELATPEPDLIGHATLPQIYSNSMSISTTSLGVVERLSGIVVQLTGHEFEPIKGSYQTATKFDSINAELCVTIDATNRMHQLVSVLEDYCGLSDAKANI